MSFRADQVLETTYSSPTLHKIWFNTQLSCVTHCHKMLQKPEA